MDDGRRMLFLQHQDDCGPGYLGARAEERGYAVEVVNVTRDELPADPHGYSMIVPLGSDDSVLDPSLPALADEQALIEEAVATGIPVLGVCFGAQLLATVLGGRVRPLERPEIGWMPVDTTDPGLVEPGPWLVWHLDAIESAGDAAAIATTDVSLQAFRHGPHLGVQFHPEATPESARAWAAKYDAAMASAGVEPSALLAETDRRRTEARARAAALLDRLVDGVSSASSPTTLRS